MVKRKRASPTAVYIEKTKRKKGNAYRLTWFDGLGKRHRQNCGRDLELAEARKIDKQAELRRGALGDLPITDLRDFVDMIDMLMAGKAALTIQATKAVLKRLNDAFGPMILQALDRPTIMAFRARRMKEVRCTTVNRDLRTVQSALSYAVDAGLLRDNFMLRWKGLMIREPEKLIRVVESVEYCALLRHARHYNFRVMLILAYRQGLRRTELCNLRWHGPNGEPLVDFERNLLRVINRPEVGELTKNRRNRSVPLHPEALQALRGLWAKTDQTVSGGREVPKHPHVFARAAGEPYKADWVSREFRAVVERAGVESCTCHDLRRSFSTHAQRAGVDKYVVKDLGGWSSVAVVEAHYTGEIDQVYREAMDKIVAAG